MGLDTYTLFHGKLLPNKEIDLMSLTKKFLADVKAFMHDFNMSKTAFGLNSTGDPHAISDWLEGKFTPKLSSVDKVYAYMEKYRKEHMS